jgi:hypothetical protein
MSRMSRWSPVLVVSLSLSMAGCGAEPSPEEGEVEPIQQAATIHDDCIASGEAPNATENPAWGDTYTRQGSTIDSSSCRDTTIVDINGVGNTKYRIASFATFKNTFYFLCPYSYVHARVMKWTGTTWLQVNSSSDTTVSSWNGTNCFAQVTRILSPSDYSASGDYRVRVRAYHADGTYETVTVASSVWQ